MASTVNILFDRRHIATNERKGTVEIEIYDSGLRKRYSTGVRIFKNQWKDGRVINHSGAIELNAKIEKIYNDYLRIVSEPDFSIEKLTNPNKNPSVSFLDWFEENIEKRKDLRPNTIKQHKSTLHVMQEWNKIINFSDLTRKNILLFDQYLKTRLCKQSSVHGHHKTLKVYINRALIVGLLKESPYEGIKISRGRTDTVKYLTESQRSAIESLELHGTIAIVRDMFLFACYTGLAYADMVKISAADIKEENGNMYLEDKRRKSGSRYKLLLLPEALEILRRHDWNLNIISNQKANIYLKAIGAMINISEPLTMHMGRHTFATWALSKGVPIEVVSKMLAHTDIATTQIYAKVLQKEVDKGFELLKKK